MTFMCRFINNREVQLVHTKRRYEGKKGMAIIYKIIIIRATFYLGKNSRNERRKTNTIKKRKNKKRGK